jgi:hypothetical protein
VSRYLGETIDDFGGSASFPATQPPPIGPFQRDYYTDGVVKVKETKVSATGKGKHTVFADE